VVLRVSPGYTSENYKLAVFKSGSTVPSPYLIDCPPIKTLNLDTTESLILPGRNSWAEDRWYQVELDTKTYLLKSSTALSSGVEGNIAYSVNYVDQFGGLQTGHTVNRKDTDTVTISRIKLDEPGSVWVRIQNNNSNELNMEITMTLEN